MNTAKSVMFDETIASQEGGKFSVSLSSERVSIGLQTLRQMFDLGQHFVAVGKSTTNGAKSSPKSAAKKGNPSTKPQQQTAGKKESNASSWRELHRAPLNFLDLAAATSIRYELLVEEGFQCWVEFSVLDTPLLPRPVCERFRPLLLSIDSGDNFPKGFGGIVARVKCFGGEFRIPMTRAGDRIEGGRVVLFLADQPPLEVYRYIFLDSISIDIFTNTSDLEESHFPIGQSSFSLRDYVTDGQTSFDEVLQVIPTRSATAETNCLASSATLHVRTDFFIPFPAIAHVNEVGSPVKNEFLSRAIINLPYKGESVELALGSLIKSIVQLPVSRGDVYAYTAPAESDLDEPEEPGKGQKSKDTPPPPPPKEPLFNFSSPVKVVTPSGISGFEIMDDECRTICVEAPLHELHQIVTSVIDAVGEGLSDLSVLLNSECFIPQRFYHKFPPLVVPPRPFAKDHDSATSDSEGEDAQEAEAGGTGGRIHRIKLREPLSTLSVQQKYLLKRTLSESCVRCVQCIGQLRLCASVRQAVERHLFPTASEVVSIERSFGQTLDLTDLFAKDEYVDVEALKTPVASSLKTIGGGDLSVMNDVNLGNLVPANIGRLVSFNGTLLQSGTRKVPPRAVERFTKCFWMMTSDGEEVLCAFPKDSPGMTIRYHIEGQVVRCDDTLLLYALGFHTLAKSFTDSRNPAYEESLKGRKKHNGDSHVTTRTSKHGAKPNATALHRARDPNNSDDDDDSKNPPNVVDTGSHGRLVDTTAGHATKNTNTIPPTPRSRLKKEKVDNETLVEPV
ncbi:hypothetical protein AGDE_06462 [Angomonas deanei]|uniref:Uncharacterized protein n=1 Tax=Angomonas deanei TaxID=59799 RepID=A0A7G2CDK6_9TRYP|nr:hypothetical protein AGDE_06462 [Angomonas deanei]CAD2217928.1 hypothetical protein, conserved [Angomonas deanei]|eukprot:EPY37472.1 hypothetical protein AGDE_06462 [Angomonas deanei]